MGGKERAAGVCDLPRVSGRVPTNWIRSAWVPGKVSTRPSFHMRARARAPLRSITLGWLVKALTLKQKKEAACNQPEKLESVDLLDIDFRRDRFTEADSYSPCIEEGHRRDRSAQRCVRF